MFDIGFSELLLIGVAALVIFGPEDLPRVARTIGHVLGKFRRYVADVKSDISREMEAADLKNLVSDVQDSARSLQASLNEQAQAFQSEFKVGVAELESEVGSISAGSEATRALSTDGSDGQDGVLEQTNLLEPAPVMNEAAHTESELVMPTENSTDEQLDLFSATPGTVSRSKE